MNERIMDYTCLQDIFDEIYEADYDGEWAISQHYHYPWKEGFQKFATKKGLLEALAYYFKIWDQGERGIAWQQERDGFKEYERASWCFYYAFDAIRFLKDPSIIPHLMQYFLPEGENRWPWDMLDVWTERMLAMVGNYHDYGPSYIPWLMKSLHLLPKGADWAAEWFFGHMIFDTFTHIDPKTGDFPCIEEALLLGDRKTLLRLAEHEVSDWQGSKLKNETILQSKNLDEKEYQKCKARLESAYESLAWAEYVLGQLLALPENVVPLHASD